MVLRMLAGERLSPAFCETVREPLLILDASLRVRSATRDLHEFGATREQLGWAEPRGASVIWSWPFAGTWTTLLARSSASPTLQATRKWNHWKKSDSRSLRIDRRAEAPSMASTTILPLSKAALMVMVMGR